MLANFLFKSPSDWGIWDIFFNKKVVVAFSGGKDSLSLMHYMNRHKIEFGWEIVACHVNHGLRGAEAERDARFCIDWCLKNGIDIKVTQFDVPKLARYDSRGFEYSARKARYSILAEVASQTSSFGILTAHTLDDQIESFFVDLCTGASVYTLAGIRESYEGIYRPFLKVSTDMVNSYLAFYEEVPVYDSSNSDTGYVRNSLRKDILPLLLSKHPEVVSTVFRLQEESLELSLSMEDKIRCAERKVSSGVYIDRAFFDSFSSIEKKYILGKWVSILSRGGQVHIDAILGLLCGGNSRRINLPGKYCCEVSSKKIHIFPAVQVKYEQIIKTAGELLVEFKDKIISFNGCLVDLEIIIRLRRPGDKLNGKPLKKLFYNKGLDLFERDTAVVFESEEKIIEVEYLTDMDNIIIVKNQEA